MSLKRIKHFIFFIIVFFSCANYAQANVIISEFVSNPTDGIEWVELFNGTEKDINLDGWKLTDGNNKTADDLILKGSISANDVIVFENLKSWLNNDGDTIILKDKASNVIDSIIYGTGGAINAPSKDKSGALINNDWVTNQDPTKNLLNPGYDKNTSDNSDEESDIDDDSSSSSSSGSSTATKVLPPLKITTKIISPKTIVAGVPVLFNSLTTTNRGETYAVGKFIWNFGDGSIKNVADSTPFEYIYEYPGEYALTLSYFDNSLNKNPDSMDKINIKVVPSEIYISSVGNISDPYVEIENKSNYEIALSNWVVTAGNRYFVIPEGTTLLPNKKIKLSPKITGFTSDDISFVTMGDPNKEIFSFYPSHTKRLASKVSSVSKATSYLNPILNDDNLQQDSLKPEDSKSIDLNNLEASASGSKVNISKSVYPFIGLLVIIGIGVVSFFLVKNKKKEDNYYVDGKINPKDMTIVE